MCKVTDLQNGLVEANFVKSTCLIITSVINSPQLLCNTASAMHKVSGPTSGQPTLATGFVPLYCLTGAR